MEMTNRWPNVLRELHLKVTNHRVRILEFLEKAQTPMAVDSIFDQLKSKDKPISLSTIYRVLDALIEKDLVKKIVFENDTKTMYEFNRQIHHHFLICLGCNRVINVESCPIHDYEAYITTQMNFHVVGHKLEFYGYCEECQKKARKAGEPLF